MTEGRLSLRPAALSDRALIFEWANDQTTREHSFSPDPIPWTVHCDWFDRILGDGRRRLYVVLSSSTPVGQVRLEPCDEGGMEVAVALAPEWRNRGLAAEAIRLVTVQADADVVHAYVKPGNEASRRAFVRAGYVEEGTVMRRGFQAMHLTWRTAGSPGGGSASRS